MTVTSRDRDQAAHQQLGRTVRRAYAPFSLSSDQRQRHHTLLDQAARRRATGRLHPHLVVIALVTWQALQPQDDQRAAAPTSTAKPAATADSPVDDRSAEPQALYMLKDGDVVGTDPDTGEEILRIDVNTGSQSPFLAVSYETGRITVGDFLRIGVGFEFAVKIYRMSDGSLDQEIPVPTLIRCLSQCEGIMFFQDGIRLHMYQYAIPPEANGNGNLANYWLGTFDLESRQWLQDIDMGSCGVVHDFYFVDDTTLIVDCASSGPLEINTSASDQP